MKHWHDSKEISDRRGETKIFGGNILLLKSSSFEKNLNYRNVSRTT